MGCRQRNPGRRQAAASRPRDRGGGGQIAAAGGELHAHCDDPKAAPDHRRRRRLRTRAGGHQRGGCRAEQDPMTEEYKRERGHAQGEKPHPETMTVNVTVNGKLEQLSVEPRMTLLDALREKLALTGTKK